MFTLPCVAFLEGIWYTVWYESGKEANRQMKKQFLEIGKIVSTHGIKGEVRVQAWCDSSEFLTEFDTLYFDKGRTAVEVEEARVHKNVVVMKLAGVNDMNAAQALRNKILYMNRDDVELAELEAAADRLVRLTPRRSTGTARGRRIPYYRNAGEFLEHFLRSASPESLGLLRQAGLLPESGSGAAR